MVDIKNYGKVFLKLQFAAFDCSFPRVWPEDCADWARCWCWFHVRGVRVSVFCAATGHRDGKGISKLLLGIS